MSKLRCENREDGTYDWVKVYVDCGEARLEYRVTECDRNGSDSLDESVDGWSDDQIRFVARMMLGIDSEDMRKIEICYQ